MVYISHNIRYLREKNKINQDKLASIINVRRTAISNYEKNISRPDYEKLLKIANFFGISMEDIITKKLSDENVPENVPKNVPKNENKETLRELEMPKSYQNSVTQNFLRAFYELKNNNSFKSNTEFAKKINSSPQSLNEVLRLRRDVTIMNLNYLFKEFGINPLFIFGISDDVFINKTTNESCISCEYKNKEIKLKDELLESYKNQLLLLQKENKRLEDK